MIITHDTLHVTQNLNDVRENTMQVTGKLLVISGIILIVLGAFFLLGGKIPWLGKLPGDIIVKRENFTFYFPITTCILISVVLSVLAYLFFGRK